MKIGFCYDNVQPARGGCSTYIADLARRLVADRHEVHLFACSWEAAALPSAMHFHPIKKPTGPRWLRPWIFGNACLRALNDNPCDVSVGFDKTWGQDVLYPQGGLHAASAEHNLFKHESSWIRAAARALKKIDLAHLSFLMLERKQYLAKRPPLAIAISDMVRHHFQQHYQIASDNLRVLRCAIDPERFRESDRFRRRQEWRDHWGIEPDEPVGLLAAMNYSLKGLVPLLRAIRLLKEERRFRLLVLGNSETGKYERLAQKLGIANRVCFGGYCPDMRNGYFSADFLIHPTFYDPCSLVVLEALACGLPVITTRHNGASELMAPPREGIVLDDPHDHAQLATAIDRLLDPGRRNACSQAARRAAGQWTFEHHYQQLLRIFQEAAARKRAA